MNVDTWEPGQRDEPPAALSPQVLQRFVMFGRQLRSGAFRHDLDAEEIRQLAPCARLDAGHWRALANELSDEDIIDLMRFFTVAERELPGWEAQEESSVIGLNKLLRGRGRKLERDFLLWIKQNSRNRFLPNGPLA